MSRLNYDLMPGLSNIYKDHNEFDYMWKDPLENLECQINKAMVNRHFGSMFSDDPETQGREHDCWSEPVHATNHSIPYLNDYNSTVTAQPELGPPVGPWQQLKPVELGCMKQIYRYIIDYIEYLLGKAKKPARPDIKCIVSGSLIIIITIAVIGVIAIYAGPLLESLGGLFGTIAQFFEFIWSSFQSLFSTVIDFVTFGFQYVVDGWNLLWTTLTYLRDAIVDLTGASTYLVMATELTGLIWCVSQLLLEIFEVELEWETTDFYNIFEFLDTPVHLILDFIEGLTGSRNILYYICKIFVIPFEIGILAISLVIGVVWFLFKEMIDILKNS